MPKKGVRSSWTDRTPEARFARVPGGKSGTKGATSSARRGALAVINVAAYVTYHIARGANVNIASCDIMAKTARITNL
jgi:hypothetical protein